MQVALDESKLSKDRELKVGACVVKRNQIIGKGYNQMPDGMETWAIEMSKMFNKPFDIWGKDKNDKLHNNKMFYVNHAERVALHDAVLYNGVNSVKGSTLYVTLHPCNECAKSIVLYGVKKVVYKSSEKSTEKLANKDEFKAGAIILKAAGIPVEELK